MNRTTTIAGALVAGLAGLFAWDRAARRAEVGRRAAHADYWHRYYDEDTVRRADAIRETHTIRSTGVTLHLDVYPHLDPDAPVVVFNHGGAGYARLFVSLALCFRERGYTVVLPDQRGQGFSGGTPGDYTIAEAAQNIVDVARWVQTRFGGPVVIAGGSLGGALSFYAAAAGAPAVAVVSLNLFDFGSDDALYFLRLTPLAHVPGVLSIMRAVVALLRPLERVRLPARWLARFDRLMDDRDATFQRQWDADPIPPRWLSLRHLVSTITTPPAVPFEVNRVPTLVLNQGRDRMVDPAITRRNYERLGGPKRYVELDYGHWSSDRAFWEAIVDASDAWFRHLIQERDTRAEPTTMAVIGRSPLPKQAHLKQAHLKQAHLKQAHLKQARHAPTGWFYRPRMGQAET